MSCRYCGETELTPSEHYICPKCKIAMAEIELEMAIKANEGTLLYHALLKRSSSHKEVK